MFYLPSSRQQRRRNRSSSSDNRWSWSLLLKEHQPPSITREMERSSSTNEKMIFGMSLGKKRTNERKKKQAKEPMNNNNKSSILSEMKQNENQTRNMMDKTKQQNYEQSYTKIILPSGGLPSDSVKRKGYPCDDDEMTVKRSNVKRRLAKTKAPPRQNPLPQCSRDEELKYIVNEAKQTALREYRRQMAEDIIKRRLKQRIIDYYSMQQENTPPQVAVMTRSCSAEIHNQQHSLRSGPYFLLSLLFCIPLLCNATDDRWCVTKYSF